MKCALARPGVDLTDPVLSFGVRVMVLQQLGFWV